MLQPAKNGKPNDNLLPYMCDECGFRFKVSIHFARLFHIIKVVTIRYLVPINHYYCLHDTGCRKH